jgi:hypothetical protein
MSGMIADHAETENDAGCAAQQMCEIMGILRQINSIVRLGRVHILRMGIFTLARSP